MGKFYTELEVIRKRLMRKEERLDNVVSLMRSLVRRCSLSIKHIHTHKYSTARKELNAVKNNIKTLLSKEYYPEFKDKIDHIAQEYTEGEIIYSVIVRKRVPTRNEIITTDVGYIYGLLDAIGEIKRAIYDALMNEEYEDATIYYKLMREIYDAVVQFKFSNALLKDFRRKVDAARIQIEQCTSDILRAKMSHGHK